MNKTIDLTPSTRILEILGDIPLAPWQCVAELVDNSLDELIEDSKRNISNPLRVDILTEGEAPDDLYLIVSDNGGGMSLNELENALRAGHSSKSRYGSLGLFGMGFNIATARLGRSTVVETTVEGSSELFQVEIRFAEMERSESFKVPVKALAAPAESHGTKVKIHLKREMAKELTRDRSLTVLKHQLGDVYSYLLRDQVPGISRTGYSRPVPAVITINGDRVTPQLPCIWSDNRTVTSAGSEVVAVQYIDKRLTEATACLHCGYWDRKNGPEFCEECGSSNLEARERRIWGWIGVQRYIDSGHYGLDFIRYGRKILTQDKSIFVYSDPDTLQTEVEYPIEMPANKGRIVGEIHLDHVPVTYQKNDFDRSTRDWQVAIEAIRGDSPLKPRSAKIANKSPLAILYSAFRRNDPGLRYLTPGDGRRAINDKAKEWASYFDKGVARYQEDTEWYEAAKRHKEIVSGQLSDESPQSDKQPAGAIDELLGGVPTGNSTSGGANPKPETASEEETVAGMLERARTVGQIREDLSGGFDLGPDLGSWKVRVVTTTHHLRGQDGATGIIAVPGDVGGKEIEVLVWEGHPAFRDFGRDIRDVAMMQLAEIIKNYGDSRASVSSIYGEIVSRVEDLRITEASILDRINRIFDLLRELMFSVVSAEPDKFWNFLTAAEKSPIENAAAVEYSTVDFDEIVRDGRFSLLLTASGICKILEASPIEFFDGAVFKAGIRTRPKEAQSRVVGAIVRDVETLRDFLEDSLLRQRHDVAVSLICLDHLYSQIAIDE
jgi:hypothetical protein